MPIITSLSGQFGLRSTSPRPAKILEKYKFRQGIMHRLLLERLSLNSRDDESDQKFHSVKPD